MLAECRQGGLHGVVYASYTQEAVGTHPAAAGGGFDLMYRLTLHVNTHSAQVQSHPRSFRQECRRVLHGAHAVVLGHEQSVTVRRTSRSGAPANYTDRHGFVQRRRQRGQRTHCREPLAFRALHDTNAFSRLSDITTEHPPALQHSMAPPVVGSGAGITGPATSSDDGSPTALGRPHTKRARHIRSRIHDCDYIGTLNTRNLSTCSMAAVRVGALSHMMQAHCLGIMAVQEPKLMGHLSEFNEFGVQYVGQPAQLQVGTRTGGTGFFVRDVVVPHVSYLGTRPRSRHRAPPKFAPVWLKVFGLEPAHDVYVASVYLPCMGSPRDQYVDALLDLQEDVEHYLALAHTIFLVGDFNARVGSQASPAVPEAQRSVAPCKEKRL